MAMDINSIRRIETCLPKQRTAAIWAPRLAERMRNLRDSIALKVKQNQWKLPPTQTIFEEAFGPGFLSDGRADFYRGLELKSSGAFSSDPEGIAAKEAGQKIIRSRSITNDGSAGAD